MSKKNGTKPYSMPSVLLMHLSLLWHWYLSFLYLSTFMCVFLSFFVFLFCISNYYMVLIISSCYDFWISLLADYLTVFLFLENPSWLPGFKSFGLEYLTNYQFGFCCSKSWGISRKMDGPGKFQNDHMK